MNTVIKINFIVLMLFGLPIFAMEADGKQKAAEQTEKDLKLFTAIESGSEEDINVALNNGANINAEVQRDEPYLGTVTRTPLAHAAARQNVSHMVLLLKNGADDTLCDFHRYFFSQSLTNGRLISYNNFFSHDVKSEIEKALPYFPAKIIGLICSKLYITDQDRALITAIHRGENREENLLQKIEKLLQNDADPNLRCIGSSTLWGAQFTSFDLSSKPRCEEQEKLLIEKRIQLIRLLLRYGATPDLAIFSMAKHRRDSGPFVNILLEHGGDTIKKDANGKLELMSDYLIDGGRAFRTKVKDTVNKTFFSNGEKYDDLANIVADYVI